MSNGLSGKVRINKRCNLVPLGGCLMFERAIEERAWLSRNTRTGLKETKGGRERSKGCLALAATCYMRHGVVMPISSSRTLPPRPFRPGLCGTQTPGDGSAGDTPFQPPAAHSGCGGGDWRRELCRGRRYERGRKTSGKIPTYWFSAASRL